MPKSEELYKFYEDLCQEIINKAALDEEEDFRENIFTQIYIDYLSEAAEIEDGNLSYHEARGVKINGYSMPEDETSLDLFVSIYKNNQDIFTVAPSEATTMIARAQQFFLKSVKGYYLELEEAYNAYDIAKSIFDLKDKIVNVRLILFTNGTVRSTVLPAQESEGYTFIPVIWDLERIYRVVTSGTAREKIDFDLIEIAGKNLECIRVDIPEEKHENTDGTIISSGGYTSYLTVFPGDVLYKIYERYNSRLLEKNVRAFLQVRGGVNKGIRDTIQKTPEMFLAYNNGISATAEEVTVTNVNGNVCTITGLKDFQIVNGGQTTASIFNSCIKDQSPLNKIYVQAKITVVKDQTLMDRVVPKISEYANTQNKVQMADFSANDIFHQEIEKMSRTIWAPAKTGGEQQTKWFYERARGQYNDMRGRAQNKKLFDSVYPKKQYFDKLQLARYENAWDQLPWITSKGGQASFREFTLRLKARGKFIPNQDYYENLIGKAILYRTLRKIVKTQGFQGYWANVADYTMAYLSYKTAQRIDLHKLWKAQDVPESIMKFAEGVSHAVYKYITESANGRNVSQWCKQEDCWKGLKKLNIGAPDIHEDLLDTAGRTRASVSQGISTESTQEAELINDIQQVDGSAWFSISQWGKETDNIPAYQCGISTTLGRYANWHKLPSWKQAKQAVKILNVAYTKGFLVEPQIQEILEKHKDLLTDVN